MDNTERLCDGCVLLGEGCGLCGDKGVEDTDGPHDREDPDVVDLLTDHGGEG